MSHPQGYQLSRGQGWVMIGSPFGNSIHELSPSISGSPGTHGIQLGLGPSCGDKMATGIFRIGSGGIVSRADAIYSSYNAPHQQQQQYQQQYRHYEGCVGGFSWSGTAPTSVSSMTSATGFGMAPTNTITNANINIANPSFLFGQTAGPPSGIPQHQHQQRQYLGNGGVISWSGTPPTTSPPTSSVTRMLPMMIAAGSHGKAPTNTTTTTNTNTTPSSSEQTAGAPSSCPQHRHHQQHQFCHQPSELAGATQEAQQAAGAPPETVERMYPGGAKLDTEAVQTKTSKILEQNAVVGAAFHWCDAMEPRAEPTFQLRDMDTTAGLGTFTMRVMVNGVTYSSATAGSMSHAMQLAAMNFLREVLGTREYPGFEALLAKADSNLAGKAASDLAGNKRKARDRERDEDGATRPAAATTNNTKNPRYRGLPRYAQLLHDLAQSHPGIKDNAEYVFEAYTERGIRRCTVRLTRGSQWTHRGASRQREILSTTTADVKGRMHARNLAAKAMPYKLLPTCKNDKELRAQVKTIITEHA